MYVSPNHPRHAELTGRTATPTAPARDEDRVLARLPRGHDAELRVALSEFEGNPFVSLRVWEANHGGEFRPVAGKGVSVRVRELGAVAKALRRAEKVIQGDAAERVEPAEVPAPSQDFDEFA